ncbi:hypothetical protein F383_05952 [Gossypium arboreum]|uniref:Uncharacterized protein n=1 Tax=Gossypium arboreum TaxID=29729 RepID=A0A0B0PKT4_GOSAR|nr:hypothetical protein F383_05952 [Gossypium arboreum]
MLVHFLRFRPVSRSFYSPIIKGLGASNSQNLRIIHPKNMLSMR